MKYCISLRQPNSILQQADEIRIAYNDKDRLINVIEDYPQKTFILEIPKEVSEDEIEWDLLKAFNEKAKVILSLKNLNLFKKCQEMNISFYWYYPCMTWYELDSIIKLSPCYILLGGPLCFSLNAIKNKTSISLRMVANIASNGYIPTKDNIIGGYIRPEDVDVYEKWITTLEFITDSREKEASLLDVYLNKKWLGNLDLLLTGLNYPVDNRAIPDTEFGQVRANCRQNCVDAGICNYCNNVFTYANALRKEHYRREKELAHEAMQES